MATPQWREVAQPDTSRFLDAMARANQNTVQGIQTIGEAYNSYYNDLKKRNTNEMLTALNQAKNPEELAQAQLQIAQMQRQYGNGYDLDQVRNAMDERPSILMQRQNAEMDFNDKRASLAARPEVNAAMIDSLRKAGMDTAALERMKSNGLDNSALANSLFNNYANTRDYAAQQANIAFNQKLALRGEDRADKQLALSQLSSQIQAADSIASHYEPEKTVVNADGSETTTSGGYARYGQAMGIVGKIMGAESARDPTAKNANSTASGLMQFTDKTFLGYVKKVKPELARGKTDQQLLAMKNNQNLQVELAHVYNKDNTELLQRNGLKATEGAQYLSWFVDGKNAVKLLKANPNTPVSQLLSSEQINANKGILQGKTAGQVVKWANTKMAQQSGGGNSGGTAYAGTAPSSGVGIDKAKLDSIRTAYQKELVDYNVKHGKADQKVNLGGVLAQLTAKSKGSLYRQDQFDIAEKIKQNPKAQSLSAAGITEVFNRLSAWQSRPQLMRMNTPGSLGKSADNVIDDVLRTEAANRKQVDKLEHPSVKYGLAIQQAFEAAGGSTSKDNALKMLDSDLYAQTHKPKAAPSKPSNNAPAPSKPNVAKPTAPSVNAPAKPNTVKQKEMTYEELKAYYVKRGGVSNVTPDNLSKANFRAWLPRLSKEVPPIVKANEAKADAARVKEQARKAKALAEEKAAKAIQYEAVRNRKAKAEATFNKAPTSIWSSNVTPSQRKLLEDLRKGK